MAEKKEKETMIYEIKAVDQKQNVLNLDLGENSEITVTTKNISWNKDKDGKEPSDAEKLKALQTLVSPASKQVEALEKFFASSSYSESKNAALSKGNFLTQQLKSGIVNYLGNFQQFAESSAKEIFERWLKGYKSPKDSKAHQNAAKVLQTVKGASETDLGF